MANYKEIVTKAVLSKGKRLFTTTHNIAVENPSTILGCWVINHLLVVGDNHFEKKIDEKYYLIDGNYETFDENNILFHNKNNLNRTYEINKNKYKNGGVCGIDKVCKFAQSSRIFSQNGYVPTLTTNNTADNCKIVVERD